ncbi:MAG: DJ-1/PfpI family protein, partial [Muribaculaceae bacterium]|nr:DJ-1/PfpI family protein [Muribaculaceae bacterium]
MNTSYIFLAPGFEEIEALTILDVMRRAGMDVKTVSITQEKTVVGAHGVPV